MKSGIRSLLVLLLFTTFSPLQAQTDIKSFIFGHSLLDHRPPLIPTPSDETTVPHWIQLLSEAAGNTYAATGQYGFLPQHAMLPPIAQWGYDIVPPAWDSDLAPFADADFNNIIITAGNFIQWQAPNLPYPGQGGITPLSETGVIIDWLTQEEPSAKIYIYENWPDMAGYLTGGTFPPTSSDLTNYYNYTLGDFHDWWIEYHDSLLLSHPVEEVRMIPVGPILADLFTNTVLDQIPAEELYEDDAPHGRATTYFLASLITYMAIYDEPAPASYAVPSIVHDTVRNNYAMIVNHIWNELLAFNLPSGESRVFYSTALPVELANFQGKQRGDGIELSWRTLSETGNEKFEVEYSFDGLNFQKIGERTGQQTTTTPRDYTYRHTPVLASNNYYRLKQIDWDGGFSYSNTIVVKMEIADFVKTHFFPNPSSTGWLTLNYLASQEDQLKVSVFELTGKLIREESRALVKGANQLVFDFKDLGKGIFLIQTLGNEQQQYHKIVLD